MAALTGKPVQVLSGGTAGWIASGLPLEHGATHLTSARSDRYRRPYEGTDNSREAMQAYLGGSMASWPSWQTTGRTGLRYCSAAARCRTISGLAHNPRILERFLCREVRAPPERSQRLRRTVGTAAQPFNMIFRHPGAA